MPELDERAFAIDAGAIVSVSIGICLAADALLLMSICVPVVLGVRLGLLHQLGRARRGFSMGAEFAVFGLCILVGAFNDWNSVVNHQIYSYGVPVYFPAISTIPLWMLLYWGMILRFILSLSQWRRLGPPRELDEHISIGRERLRSVGVRLAGLCVLVLATRQFIYRYYGDPILSWAPFAAALLVYALVFRPRHHDIRVMALFALIGPAVEMLYIQVGGLHHYALGWVGGVPLWIILWWMLAVPIWKELGGRAFERIRTML